METIIRKKNPKYVFVFSYLNDTMIIFIACMMNEGMRATFADRKDPLQQVLL